VSNREITVGATAFGVTSSLLRDHRGGLLGAMVLVRDLTEEKKTEALIRRIDRVTALGQLSAGIAHEIRNPLASISFNVQLLAKRLNGTPEAAGLIHDTRSSSPCSTSPDPHRPGCSAAPWPPCSVKPWP
jgi:signal transduction histidine kinase